MSLIKNIRIAGVGLASLIALAGCSHIAQTNTNTNTNLNTNEPVINTAPAYAVNAEDQEIKNGKIMVASVLSGESGWIVIHADKDGAPGAVIGMSPIKAGENLNVEVAIDTKFVTETLYAMLHTDSGEAGKYEFPGEDAPVKIDDTVITDPFKVTNAMIQKKEKFEETEKKEDDTVQAPIKEFTMTAKKWEFSPSSITVNKGDTVKLTVNSLDVEHGIIIPAFNINENLSPRKSVTIKFTANKTGTFTYSCNVFCGSGHPTMTGSIIVK